MSSTSASSLHTLGAADAARRMARGELRAADLMDACLDRIAAREAEVQAFAHLDADAARAAARRLDAQPSRGPLHGLPLGVKDLFDTADMPTAYGTPVFAGQRPRADAAAVALCRAAGAVVVGKTVTTEFASFQPGPTRNPVDLAHTPGGSSSGSAAAVADAMLPLALGTQTAGSIVRPAAFCGVVGFKPSLGRVPKAGVKSLSESLDTIGGFGRSVEDAALLASVLIGDPALADVEACGLPRIGLTLGPHAESLAPETPALFERVVARAARHCAGSAVAVLPGWFAGVTALQTRIMLREMAQSLAWERQTQAPHISAVLTDILARGAAVPGAQHGADLAEALALRHRIGELFGDFDVLLAPSAAGEAPRAVDGTGDPLWCRSWTLLGLPTLHLPLGHGPTGLPIGLQLIGKPFEDAALLRAGAAVHALLRDD